MRGVMEAKRQRLRDARRRVIARPDIVDTTPSERERRRRLIAALDDGSAPREFVKTYIETGVMDGRLWPIRWPCGLRKEPNGP